jgi:hypothetical protein
MLLDQLAVHIKDRRVLNLIGQCLRRAKGPRTECPYTWVLRLSRQMYALPSPGHVGCIAVCRGTPATVETRAFGEKNKVVR